MAKATAKSKTKAKGVKADDLVSDLGDVIIDMVTPMLSDNKVKIDGHKFGVLPREDVFFFRTYLELLFFHPDWLVLNAKKDATDFLELPYVVWPSEAVIDALPDTDRNHPVTVSETTLRSK